MTNSGLQRLHSIDSTITRLKYQNKELKDELKKASTAVKEAAAAAEQAQKATTTANNKYENMMHCKKR